MCWHVLGLDEDFWSWEESSILIGLCWGLNLVKEGCLVRRSEILMVEEMLAYRFTRILSGCGKVKACGWGVVCGRIAYKCRRL